MLKDLLSICLVFLLFLSIAQAGDEDPVLAKAGNYVIKKSDLDRLIGYYSPDRKKYLQENPQQKIVLLKRILEVKIVSEIAKKEGFDKIPDVKEQLEYMVNDQLSREYLSKGVAKDLAVSDDDISQYYNANKDKFSTPAEVRARHIRIRVSQDSSADERKKAKDKAQEILARIKNGGDFAKIAEEVSEDPGSKTKGGDLGYFARGKMVQPFEDAAFSLQPGQVSEVVETQFGYHIIKVENYRESKIRNLDEVKDRIREQLKTELSQSKAKEFLDKVSIAAGMEIYNDKITGETEKIK
jgi:peptidyl-prolyl cis-trans isomerase C